MSKGVSPEEALALKHANADAVVAPEAGIVLWEINGDGENVQSIEPYIGKQYKEGDFFCYIENNHGQILEIPAALGGKLVEIAAKQGGYLHLLTNNDHCCPISVFAEAGVLVATFFVV